MEIITDLANLDSIAGGVVSIGNFDGVHRGHQKMLSALTEMGRHLQAHTIAMTFDPPPVAILAPERLPPRLNTPGRKAELMARAGIDFLLVYPTDRELLNLTATEFFHAVILGKLQVRGLVEGENFCFGKNRIGNSQLLAEFCKQHLLELQIIPTLSDQNQQISSTEIRSLLQQGEFAQAVSLLGHPYQIEGIVGHGASRGRQLGFPTANLEQITTLIPQAGVYAGRCLRGNHMLAAAIHIGGNPTFAVAETKFEVHLIDHNEDLYGQVLQVELFEKIRPIQQFSNAQELQTQLQWDVKMAQKIAEKCQQSYPFTNSAVTTS